MRRTDPDWHAGFVLNQVLGGSGFTSRLMKKIRSDEGLTYGVYSTLEPGPYWRGDMTGRVQTKNRSVAYVLRLALDEMRKLREQPITEDELRVIKDGIIEAFPSQWSSKPAIVSRFADEAREGWPPDWWAIVAVPLVAALAAIPIGIWGAALGHVALRLRGRVQGPRMVPVAALVVAASLPALVAREVHRGLGLEAAVREVPAMDVVRLEAAFDRSPWRGDRYFLAALAQHPGASPRLLARIAAEPEPALHEPLGSLWDVMGGNRDGLSVMRLVARHPNTPDDTLARLAADADEPVARDAAQAIARRANPRSGAR